MNTTLTAIKRTKLPYNSQVVIPKIFIDDNNLNAGDTVVIHRGNINGIDAIIILPDANIVINDSKNLVKNTNNLDKIQKK